eukprot:scaffold54750_cov59-Phaeocystis_antarctica.AAC.1
MRKKRSTGPTRVVPHRSTTPARTCLAVSQADMAALNVRLDPAASCRSSRGIDSGSSSARSIQFYTHNSLPFTRFGGPTYGFKSGRRSLAPIYKPAHNAAPRKAKAQQKRSTGPSRVVPHRSTTPARTCLTSLFGWEAVSQADMAALSVQPDPASPTRPARGIDSREEPPPLPFYILPFGIPSAQGQHTEKGKQERKDIVEEKSAAPGLPAWSPTAVLPRLEPA